jgi:uncharacterized protein involved in type VI secretion and phage assembly
VSRGGPVAADVENIVARLADAVEHRFFGKYRALVVDNDDPEQMGRLKVSVPSLLGDQVVTGWAVPCVPYGGGTDRGMLFIPEAGDGVWVEFEEGDLEFPIWVGTFWSKPGGDAETPKPNDPDGAEAGDVQSPPTRKIIKTLKGHTLQFEDADGDEMVILTEATNGRVIRMDKDGVKIDDGAGSSIEMTADAFTIVSAVPFTIDASGQPIVLVGDTIDMNKG